MSSIFEQLMEQGRELSMNESKVVAPKKAIKISSKKVRVESMKIFEEEDVATLDSEFDSNFDSFDMDAPVEDADVSEVPDDEVVLVIDPELPADEDVPEDAAEAMIGSKIYKCPICGANYACRCEEESTIECDEDGVPTECPVCGDDADQILIGEIAPAENAGEVDELPPIDAETEDAELPSDAEAEEEEAPVEEAPEEEEKKEEEPLEDSLKVERRPVNSDKIAKRMESRRATRRPRRMESHKPHSALEFNEVKFESLISQVIKENYRFNPQFKVRKVTTNGKNLKIEYLVKESKHKVTRGTMVCEGFNPKATRMSLKIKDKGAFTESFTKKPAMIVECICMHGMVTPTSVVYDYRVKVNESLYRVTGKAGKVAKSTRRSK